MSEQVVVTHSCGHRQEHGLIEKGERRAQAIEMIEGSLCSSCWRSEPQARGRLRRAILNSPRKSGTCPLGHALEMFVKWWLSMGSSAGSSHGSITQPQHQLCLLANKIGDHSTALRDGFNGLLLKLTDAMEKGQIEAPQPPPPPYVHEPDTRPADEQLADSALTMTRYLREMLSEWSPSTVAAARARVEAVEESGTRAAAIALLDAVEVKGRAR